ncbi:alpha/beta hydrolase [Alcanivorax sp. DP30]|uniref:alpha/beta hydrolase n=1 Tax=Alcanivorax sp. DP30 TaxID=2606217 RepID=UPI0013692F1F|nr:alpha/beta hydrolase [Alcanivorax sp. DP30]MZR61597.1 alpha/beta hydrolase [Alcanivorax sp. DP30]
MWHRTRQWLRRVVDNRSAIRRDLRLGLYHVADLPRLLLPLGNEPGARSELSLSSYSSTSDAFVSLLQLIVPATRESISQGSLVCHPPRVSEPSENTRWFFINGMGTAPPVALLNASEIARHFQRPVTLIHTPTWGIVRDVAESITARTLRKDGKLSRPALNVIIDALEKQDQVVLICHSQGTIVASYIVRKLLRNPSVRHLVRKLEIYCIGGVADSLEIDPQLTLAAGHPVPYVEHFANGRDYLAEVGILAHLDSTAGTVYCLAEHSGHLLNQHYLPAIVRGDFCQRSSRLYGYARGRQPGLKGAMSVAIKQMGKHG